MVAASSNDVDRTLGRTHSLDLGSQDPRTARQFLCGLTTYLEGHQEAAHLGRGCIAAGHDVEGALGLVHIERLPAAYLRQKATKIVDIAAHLDPVSFYPLPARPVGA